MDAPQQSKQDFRLQLTYAVTRVVADTTAGYYKRFPGPLNLLLSCSRYPVLVLCKYTTAGAYYLQQGGGGGGGGGGARSSSAHEATSSTSGGGSSGVDGLLFWSPRWQPTGLEGENYFLGVVPK